MSAKKGLTLATFLLCFLVSPVAFADFTVDKLSLSRTQANGVLTTVVAYFKVCFTKGTKGITVTTHYGDTSGRTNLSQLKSRSFTTNNNCIEDGVSFALGNNTLKGNRFIHVKLEQTGGPTIWDKLAIAITGTPEIGFVQVPVISGLIAEAGDTITVSFRLKNTGLTRSDATSQVKILYTHISNDVLDPSKTKQFSASVSVPTIKAQSEHPSSLTTPSLSMSFKLPTPAERVPGTLYDRLYIAVMIDPDKKLDDASRGNNYKTFSIYYQLPDLDLRKLEVKPNSLTGAPLPNGNPATTTLLYTVYNNGAVTMKEGTIQCEMEWNDAHAIPLRTFKTTQSASIKNLKPSAVDQAGITTGMKLTLPTNAKSTTTITCKVSEKNNAESPQTNNEKKTTLTLTGWYDDSIEKLVPTPSQSQDGKTIKVSYDLKHRGTISYYYAVSIEAYLTLNGKKYSIPTNVAPGAPFNNTKPQSYNLTLPNSLPPGQGTLTVGIDPQYGPNDIDRSNNAKTIPFTIVPNVYDYYVEKLKVTPTSVERGKKVSLSFTLGHTGNTAYYYAMSFEASFTIGGKSYPIPVNVAPTAPHQNSRTETFDLTLPATLPPGQGTLKLTIPATFGPKDTNPNNNSTSTSLTILVDVDKDGFTNDKDCDDNDKAINPQAKEVCDGKDNNCDGNIDETCPCVDGKSRACFSGTTGCVKDVQNPGTYKCIQPCKAGTQRCTRGVWGACQQEVKPSPESCNGKDDDCNGMVDDTIQPVPCYNGGIGTENVGLCKGGSRTCQNGTLSACQGEVKPSTDVCDGLDNDCDGKTDEEFQTKGDPCTVGQGTCKKTGKLICSQDKSKLECSVKAGPAGVEACNGKDDDCNGFIDDNIPAKACYTGPPGTRNLGQCKDGKEMCVAGKIQCKGEVKPAIESCNNKDDNCNGQIDDNVAPKSCYTGPAGTKGIGPCSAGTQACKKGVYEPCKGQVTPKVESCNGVDDNCNGKVDESISRPCYTGPAGTSDVGECKRGVQLCVGGRFNTACAGETKPTSEQCDNQDNDCDGLVDEDNVCNVPPKPSEESAEETAEEQPSESSSEPNPEAGSEDAGSTVEVKRESVGTGPDQQAEQELVPPVGVGCQVTPTPNLLSFLLLLALMLLLPVYRSMRAAGKW
ncbi:MAG: hypothetical protein EP343_02405 [Deltaproteobacteria bacterium]|nr:MAG: hypothetical protein EP343_02405 [Deltaproteobacteria bacterium]